MIDMSLFRSHLQNLQDKRNPSKEVAQGRNFELTPEALVRNLMTLPPDQSPLKAMMARSEREELKKDFPQTIN